MTTTNHHTGTRHNVKQYVAVSLILAATIALSLVLASLTGPDPALVGVAR